MQCNKTGYPRAEETGNAGSWANSSGADGFSQISRRELQVLDKALIFARLGVLVGHAQQIGWMHRHQRLAAFFEVDQMAAAFVDRRDLAEHGLRGGRAK